MSPTAADVHAVARFFQRQTGVGLEGHARERAAPVIAECMAEAGFERAGPYLHALGAQPRLFDALADRITIGESYFFRDPWHFELIMGPIAEEVAVRRGRGGPGIQIWSAGCADGQEIYSAAIGLAEAGALGASYLLATDLSLEALARARTGRYRDWAVRGPDGARARRWMQQRDRRWELHPRIRESVHFVQHNLASDPPPQACELDVILCRNVLIYFDEETIRAVARRLCQRLRPGGWLLTGPSDPPLGELACLEPVVRAEGVVYRRPLADVATVVGSTCAEPPAPAGDVARRSVMPLDPDRLRRLARIGPAAALEAAELARLDHPNDEWLALFRANLLVALDRRDEAMRALRDVLERTAQAPVASYLLATLQLNAGARAAARASFAVALSQASALPAERRLPHGDGERAGQLADAARRQIAALDREVS